MFPWLVFKYFEHKTDITVNNNIYMTGLFNCGYVKGDPLVPAQRHISVPQILNTESKVNECLNNYHKTRHSFARNNINI